MSPSFAADLHIHGIYSGATSDKMVFDTIAEQANLKGLDIVGTGDILHSKWIQRMRDELRKVEEGTYRHPVHGTNFVLTVEVEDVRKVHHLLILPSLDKAEELREKLDSHSTDMNIDGRPRVEMEAPAIVEMAVDSECLVGPAHAFTPWTSIFKEFDSLEECYEDQSKNTDFLELGLSADTFMADRIKELGDLAFLSNSDAHSPWPNKLGREFNRFELPEPTSPCLFESIERRENLTLNVGLSPKLGKYHLTACSKCHEKFSVDDAKSRDWKCNECGGGIKKGVSDRVDELADRESPSHPSFRPDYLHTAPLSEVIALAWDRSDPRSRDIRRVWNDLVEEFGDEVSVLVDVSISEIGGVSDRGIANMVKAFRDGSLDIEPGGGGSYGNLELPPELVEAKGDEGQKTLSEF